MTEGSKWWAREVIYLTSFFQFRPIWFVYEATYSFCFKVKLSAELSKQSPQKKLSKLINSFVKKTEFMQFDFNLHSVISFAEISNTHSTTFDMKIFSILVSLPDILTLISANVKWWISYVTRKINIIGGKLLLCQSAQFCLMGKLFQFHYVLRSGMTNFKKFSMKISWNHTQ